MRRNDWIGLGISILVHVLVLVLMSAWKTEAPEELIPVGYVEVNMGTFAEGRPVRSAPEEPTEEAPSEAEQEAEPTPPTPEAPQERATEAAAEPVDLPDAVPTPDEPIPDDAEPTPADEPVVTRPEPQPEPPQPEPQPLGRPTSDRPTGATTGDDGSGDDEERASPYDIEGLNRVPRTAPLPGYVNRVNATIRVRITVGPDGRITQRIPIRRDDPALLAEVMRTLERWRFNPLPSAAPQEPQTGTITFTFRLE
jgi:protein TonB